MAYTKEVVSEEQPDQVISVGHNLPGRTRKALVDLLRRYKHIFAWDPIDMVGVNREIIEHKLMIKPGTREVKQKRESMGEIAIE